MNIFKKAIKAAEEFETASKTPEFRRSTAPPQYTPPPMPPVTPPRENEMYGLKLYIPFDDLNTYIHNHIDEAYKDHTFIPVKVEVNELDLSLDISLLSANPIKSDGVRYRFDLNEI